MRAGYPASRITVGGSKGTVVGGTLGTVVDVLVVVVLVVVVDVVVVLSVVVLGTVVSGTDVVEFSGPVVVVTHLMPGPQPQAPASEIVSAAPRTVAVRMRARAMRRIMAPTLLPPSAAGPVPVVALAHRDGPVIGHGVLHRRWGVRGSCVAAMPCSC